jgi:hypothetical protein
MDYIARPCLKKKKKLAVLVLWHCDKYKYLKKNKLMKEKITLAHAFIGVVHDLLAHLFQDYDETT